SISQKRVQSYYIFPPPPNIFANIFSRQKQQNAKHTDNHPSVQQKIFKIILNRQSFCRKATKKRSES
ncbi:MAG: hypothetical protein K2J12_00810, partial [Muribaculaceae bacterium]|nr:hypothetical protein [Muribaculaceae bacterium]